MAINSTWLDHNLGLHRQFSGDISVVDVVKDTLALQQHPNFKGMRYIIDDFINVTNIAFSSDHTLSIANVIRMRANTKEYLKVAIISRDTAESKAAAEGFCEQIKSCHYQCRVFQSLDDAKAWVAEI